LGIPLLSVFPVPSNKAVLLWVHQQYCKKQSFAVFFNAVICPGNKNNSCNQKKQEKFKNIFDYFFIEK
jgi:hypothetical protein